MRRIPVLIALILPTSIVSAQGFATATQVVTLEVRSITSLSVSGDPSPLTITSFDPGASITSVVDNSTRYSLTSNKHAVRLSLSIDRPMPSGARLLAHFESGEGSSSGRVDLSEASSPVLAVSGIPKGTDVDQRIVYTLEADADGAPMPSQTRTVTITLTD